ncbi:MAG: hypothetical protein MPK03_02830 [Alphaproteobacteria bacterium]|nr:hypothetical protein [Alphaproteobacteria bacterium]MDA8008903.1 hypothetical protein [Alphaproteobacteria bacterium]
MIDFPSEVSLPAQSLVLHHCCHPNDQPFPLLGLSRVLATRLVSEPVAFLADLSTVWPAVVTVVVWNTTPLVAVSLLAVLQTIPEELNESVALQLFRAKH